MSTPHPSAEAARARWEPAVAAPGARRWVLWLALVSLLVVGQTLLVVLTLEYEDSQALDRAEDTATAVAMDIRRVMVQRVQSLQTLQAELQARGSWRESAQQLLREQQEIVRVEFRNAQYDIVETLDRPFAPSLFATGLRNNLRGESDQACTLALRERSAQYSRTYFVPIADGGGSEVIDVCLPVTAPDQQSGFLVATLPLTALLQSANRNDSRYELSFVEPDGTRLARHGSLRGANHHVVRRMLDLAGSGLELKVDSTVGRPGLLPTFTLALVLALSIALSVVVALLLRDMRRRTQVERALAESLAFRKAMENSLITGLRARDMDGRITYVNPAFCAMVGFPAGQLLGTGGPETATPPYWPPDRASEYRERLVSRKAAAASAAQGDRLPPTLQGFESVFLRSSGERFPVLIYEAPLVDGSGRQTGWMSAAVDISEQQRSEEQARVQQERLQATARLATMGEMASLLSHELNQPLSAISSYANGSLNLLREPDDQTLPLLREAIGRMAEQAERAGRVIKSVHDFVRRREHARESLGVAALLDAVLPLVRLQARKSGARVVVDLPEGGLRLYGDRTMLEQVLLNLTRNGIQAMERGTPSHRRELVLRACTAPQGRVLIEVIDHGPGIAPEVAERLFTPFFTTREDGMGLGLSLCRTVVEQHGGTLEHEPVDGGGCCFRFTVAQPPTPSRGAASAAALGVRRSGDTPTHEPTPQP